MRTFHRRTLPIHPQISQSLSSCLLNSPFSHAIAVRGSSCVWCGHTLHGSFRAQTRQRTHGADHEVLDKLGAFLAALACPLIGAKRRDLGGAALALEGAVEAGRGMDLGDAAGLQVGAAGTGDGQRVLGP